MVSNQSAIKLWWMVLKVSSNTKKTETVDQDTPWYSDRERFTHHKIVPSSKKVGAIFVASDGHQWETDIKVSLNEGTSMSERIWIFNLASNYCIIDFLNL